MLLGLELNMLLGLELITEGCPLGLAHLLGLSGYQFEVGSLYNTWGSYHLT
ncbi:hypothetical protein HanXRQr2_Chr01g0024391 [Helianthus annuus]|uniref:Uncharacterized protein n=1 Tax=Helianthus annuus TaxID=4232 RepID=A0A9K3P2F9_HELAN|nr:hypothetical protein HanXRQr2_Chr01g0024391 [Helianthus annuus]